MLYALFDGIKSKAIKGASGYCPFCNERVIAKVGEIKRAHWAHKSGAECDSWADSETDWHLEWKSLFPPSQVEVVIERNGTKHRADVVAHNGQVIEFQHSYIDGATIAERESFYGFMAWMFDVIEPVKDYRLRVSPIGERSETGPHRFKWDNGRHFLECVQKPTYLDLGGRILYVESMQPNPVRGWGHIARVDEIALDWAVEMGQPALI